MKYIALLAILFALFRESAGSSPLNAITVSHDGSGQFSSITSALASIPDNNSRNVVIFIKNGVYYEKLYVTKSHITLAGEDRDSTRIVFAELRKNWVKEHDGSDWGTAVINIDSSVTDLTLANLTVHNNYGGLFGDHDHQFAIWGRGTRVMIVNCNIIADGGDTLSLWNKNVGMYYHAFCYFEGWVDFVCPRGWCYITDSRFYGHNKSASIWADGDVDPDQKFVIRYSSFDGVEGFPLGRHHLDAQFYLLDCEFSRNMADTPFYRPPSSPRPYKWGERRYFYNCHREGGDFDWFADNLSAAAGSPVEEAIDAQWTFHGRWDPEGTMPAVMPMVFLPRPRDKSYRNSADTTVLRWVPARNADSHNVYFGKTGTSDFKGNQKGNAFTPGKLEPHTAYFWRIDEIVGADTLRGPTWKFTTR